MYPSTVSVKSKMYTDTLAFSPGGPVNMNVPCFFD